ncbi:hypothetical protein VE00_11114 [Pseudogymnoascus sp. WSF 3629]|nr:hypothetical protein VE00_11114 [Pseudogymnoascus sp. WSF 3629]
MTRAQTRLMPGGQVKLSMYYEYGAIETCKNVVAGTVKNAIAVIQPPGHHAKSDEAMGFCFLNNIAIAARGLTEGWKTSVLARELAQGIGDSEYVATF